MSTPAPTVTLITGCNRGLGRGFVQLVSARPNNVVLAAVRDPTASISQELLSIPTAPGSCIKLLKIDASVETDPDEAVKSIKQDGYEYIDRVIANAGLADVWRPFHEVSADNVRTHMEINLFTVITLIHATVPLLRESKAAGGPKLILIGSGLGSLNRVKQWIGPWYCYGVTKAALHYTALHVHQENKWLTSVALSPGFAKTAMGNAFGASMGMEPTSTIEESVEGCMKVIDEASRDKFGGDVVEFNGESIGA